ncbi:MAG: hypothetical protein LBD90_06335 [Bifidobacteriaceae bacterium]|jgi:hypothetical protein|nr:hypothetical protein [Bifidobacteriaceae bacterium]
MENANAPRASRGAEAAPLTPEQALALAAEATKKGRWAFEVDERLLYGAWAVAWLFGNGVLSLASRQRPDLWAPAWAFAVYAALILGAMGVSIAHSAPRSAGTRGPSRWRYAAWGWAWLIACGFGMTGIGSIGGAINSPKLASALYATVAALIVGCLFMGGGSIMGERAMYALGAWFVVTAGAGAVVAVEASMSASYLVMAVCGGGGLALAALLAQFQRSRGRRGQPASPAAVPRAGASSGAVRDDSADGADGHDRA